MSERLAAAAGPGADYESMPYDSMPFAQTQPSNLSAVATFFGLETAPVDHCRVLELGCASGGNIIPLAARYPEARFTGIDLSDRHVAIGNERIAALGLSNIEIRQGDLADPDVVAGEFDYIICHGVYSWVPPPAQDGILNICGRQLAPNGIAYISYNVLPGWQLRGAIRDIFQFHAGECASPQEGVAKGREMLARLAAISRESTPYGQLIRHEAKLLATYPDTYIMGEFLVDQNRPCYFRDFVERAEHAGLAYLADTDLRSSLPETISPEFSQLLAGMAGPDRRMREQYFDFFQGRQFRQSLLVRKSQSAAGQPTVDHRRLAALHFSSQLRLEAGTPGAALTLREPKGKSITTNDPMAARALDSLGAAFPETRSLPQLMNGLAINGAAESAEVRDRILASLVRLIVAGLVDMSSLPVTTGRAAAARPVAWRVARQDQLASQPWVTSLRHMPVRLDAATSALLPLLDGSNDRAALRAHARDQKSEADIAGEIEKALQNLERMALLEPTGDTSRHGRATPS